MSPQLFIDKLKKANERRMELHSCICYDDDDVIAPSHPHSARELAAGSNQIPSSTRQDRRQVLLLQPSPRCRAVLPHRSPPAQLLKWFPTPGRAGAPVLPAGSWGWLLPTSPRSRAGPGGRRAQRLSCTTAGDRNGRVWRKFCEGSGITVMCQGNDGDHY